MCVFSVLEGGDVLAFFFCGAARAYHHASVWSEGQTENVMANSEQRTLLSSYPHLDECKDTRRRGAIVHVQ